MSRLRKMRDDDRRILASVFRPAEKHRDLPLPPTFQPEHRHNCGGEHARPLILSRSLQLQNSHARVEQNITHGRLAVLPALVFSLLISPRTFPLRTRFVLALRSRAVRRGWRSRCKHIIARHRNR